MDLRDPHLEKALQHAPDRDLQPGDAVRERVLDYAAEAAKPAKAGWLVSLMENLRHWHITSAQMAGMGSVAVALMVLLMVREQRPADSEWAAPAALERTAKADAPKRKARAAKPAADELAQEEMAVPAEAPPASEVFAESAAAPEAGNMQSAPAEAADTVPAVASLPESAMPMSVESADAEAETAADLSPESRKPKMESPAKARAVEMPGKSDDADLRYALMTQGGKALAEQDIRAGNLRLLSIGTPQGSHCDDPVPQVLQADTETGYPIEVVDVCVAPVALLDEVETYNQAIRAWYKQHVSR